MENKKIQSITEYRIKSSLEDANALLNFAEKQLNRYLKMILEDKKRLLENTEDVSDKEKIREAGIAIGRLYELGRNSDSIFNRDKVTEVRSNLNLLEVYTSLF